MIIRSPILSLQNAIQASAFRIAPERDTELAAWRDGAGPALALTDDREFSIRVNIETKEVIIPIAAIEFLWSAAHAFYVLYHQYVEDQKAGDQQFDVGMKKRTADAWCLLQWSIDNMYGQATDPWPENLPRPVRYPEEGSDTHVANELFLCAIAWIIHHEFQHLQCQHTPLKTAYSLDQEKEADLMATSWILSRCPDYQQRKKRSYGIAVAILAIQLLERPGTSAKFRTHPKALERLNYCLMAAGCKENDEVFPFAIVVMQLQLEVQGIKVQLNESETFEEMLGSLMVAFTRGSASDY